MPKATHTLPHYSGDIKAGDASRHDGRLRPVVGVHEMQVVRSNPGTPQEADGQPFDFRLHPFLMYWKDYFWSYHLGAIGSDESSKRGMLQWSSDGLSWRREDSTVAFPQATHQRAAFFVASNGRAFVTTWYGRKEAARGQRGSRLVRELIGPGSLGPIYLLKANHRGPSDDLNVEHFDRAQDEGFKRACRELLDNPLYVQQWQEEDQDPAFYAFNGVAGSPMARAFAWYVLPDERIVGMWKGPHLVVAEPSAWSDRVVPVPTKETTHIEQGRLVDYSQFGANGGSKQWGQRTSDGRYAMVFNAPGELHKRWPLVVTTSADGIDFDGTLLAISGDISPQRYRDATFDHKDGGPAYVRGITPNNPGPPDDAMWLTYSNSKEDIWVARVPIPIQHRIEGDVDDDFSAVAPGSIVPNWNIRSGQLAPVGIKDVGGKVSLCLADRDAADYAKAVRVFEESSRVSVKVVLSAQQTEHGTLQMELTDQFGARPVRLILDKGGKIVAANGNDETRPIGQYEAGKPLSVELVVDCESGVARVSIDDSAPVNLAFAEPCRTVERLELRTGEFRLAHFERIGHYGAGFIKEDLPAADDRIPEALYGVRKVTIRRLAE